MFYLVFTLRLVISPQFAPGRFLFFLRLGDARSRHARISTRWNLRGRHWISFILRVESLIMRFSYYPNLISETCGILYYEMHKRGRKYAPDWSESRYVSQTLVTSKAVTTIDPLYFRTFGFVL